MPDRRSIFRLLALAGFLLTVALALWLAELRPLLVVVVMAAALLVAWTIEWLSWRQDVLRLGAETRDRRRGGGLRPRAAAARPPVRAQEGARPARPDRLLAEAVEPEPEPVPQPEPAPVEPEPREAPVPVAPVPLVAARSAAP